jgi:hypothetical protein
MPYIFIHAQPFHDQRLCLILHRNWACRRQKAILLNRCTEKTPSAGKPKEDEIEFAAREELHRDI